MKRILCFFFGHPCTPTGRHGSLLSEWFCDRCGRFYISHVDHGDMLIPRNAEIDRYLTLYAKARPTCRQCRSRSDLP